MKTAEELEAAIKKTLEILNYEYVENMSGNEDNMLCRVQKFLAESVGEEPW